MSAIDSHLSEALSIIRGASFKIKSITDVNIRVQGDSIINQRSYSYDRTYGLNNNGNIFNPNDWRQTGVTYNQQEWGDTIYELNKSSEAPEPEESWLNKHTNVQANLWQHEFDALDNEYSVGFEKWESEHHNAELHALGYETNGEASLSYGENGLQAEVLANAEVYALKAEYEGTYGPAYVNAEAFVGAEANASANVNFNPLSGDASVSAGGEAFAGGKIEAAGGFENDNGKVEANAGVTYGIGIEAKADVGLEDGKIKAEVDLGATLGLGVDVGFDIEVDVKETAKDLTGWIPGIDW